MVYSLVRVGPEKIKITIIEVFAGIDKEKL